MVSQDGPHWLITRIETETSTSSICLGNARYVAYSSDRALGAGGGQIHASTDGAKWRLVLGNLPEFGSVSFEAGRFFATLFGGAIFTTLDGIEWREARPSQRFG